MNIVQLIKMKPDLITYSPASVKSIANAESLLKVVFSKDYIDYIKAFGIAIFDGHELTGICDGKRLDVVKNTVAQRKLNPFVPKNWYVLETLNINGIVIWQTNSGKIYQTMPKGNIKLLSMSLAEYLEKQNVNVHKFKYKKPKLK